MFCFLDDFLRDLLWTGVSRKNWPNRTCLIASIKDKDGEDIFNKRFENTPFHEHAEEIMLCDGDFLDAVAAHHHHGIEITLTLNYSPCSNCAKRLKKFYENNGKNTNFTIQFSFLYRIQEEKNQRGLRNLDEAGVNLQAMNPNSWREVGIDLESMAFNSKERIMKRDEKTDDDLREILSTDQNEQEQDTSEE